MNILFVTHYSKKYGVGHLSRCNKLSKKLKKKNKVYFLLDEKDKNLSKIISKNSNIIIKKNIFNKSNELIKIIKELKNPIVILDSYLSNFKFEKKIISHCKKLVIIDDLKKKHCCDIYINPNLLSFKFTKKITAKYKLLGTKFSFIDLPIVKNKKKKITKFKNILVFMGATDSKNLSNKIYNAVSMKKLNYLKFNFIRGLKNKKLKNTKKNNKFKNIRFIDFSKNFSNYLRKTDFFISSGGSSVWDSIFLKKKTLIFNHSWRQFENSNNLNKKGLIKEFNNKLTKNNILDFIISETKSKKNNIHRYKDFLDSKGIDRIVKKII